MISSRRCGDQTGTTLLAANICLAGRSALTLSLFLRSRPHLLPLQSLLLFLLEVFLPLKPLALSLLAGFGLGLLPLEKEINESQSDNLPITTAHVEKPHEGHTKNFGKKNTKKNLVINLTNIPSAYIGLYNKLKE